MHCYQTLAAVTLIARTLESMPEVGHRLPPAIIADWLAEYGIEPEEVLFGEPDKLAPRLRALIMLNQSRLARAA